MVAYSSNFRNDFPSAETLKINYYWVASGEWRWTLSGVEQDQQLSDMLGKSTNAWNCQRQLG
jgi:phosphodiesterase/alkaline phosphatase D-like protein